MEFSEILNFIKPKKREERQQEKIPRSPEIKNPAIASLEKPMQKILKEMSKNIDAGEYTVILGEDASGRLPALLFQKVLTGLYKDKKFSVPETLLFGGEQPNDAVPRTLFFAAQEIFSDTRQEKVINDFKKIIDISGAGKIVENKKILVVTDTILTGNHLSPITHALQTMGIKFDIATIGTAEETKRHIKSVEDRLGGKIFCGQYNVPFSIYNKPQMAGVVKSKEPSIFAEDVPNAFQKNTAREDINILANKLIRQYGKSWYRGGFR